MTQNGINDHNGRSLECAQEDLPYELGEMPEVSSGLARYGIIGFLESREGTEKWARYGIAAAGPIMEVSGRGGRYRVRMHDGEIEEGLTDDPLQLLKALEPKTTACSDPGDFRYLGGWMGSIGYETICRFEGITPAATDDIGLPDYVFFLPSIIVLKDAVQRKLTLVAWAARREQANALLNEVAAHLKDNVQKTLHPGNDVHRIAVVSFARGEFMDSVALAKKLIHDGELIQVVLSRRWEIAPAPNPGAVYEALSALNPSPYHFYLNIPGGVLLGASPELLVRREKEVLTVRPIAGTRRRGKDECEDGSLEGEMLADPKERAEHIMLVDLGRNDLGRVSSPGSVEVTRRMTVERYSHVMHLVSEVQSRIAENRDSFDVLRACFPAGTVTGAPKVRAMQAISDMEPVVRGPYAGGVGYFDFRGNMDFCITIRSIFYSGERAFVQSGAGIVADSVPERERDEIVAKAQAMFKAFGKVDFEKD